MKTFRLELYGTITRDIIWRECDAKDEAEARAMAAAELPTYRLNAIEEISSSWNGLRDEESWHTPNSKLPMQGVIVGALDDGGFYIAKYVDHVWHECDMNGTLITVRAPKCWAVLP